MVRAARDVFWEHGYGAASLALLQAATGLSKSSMYETYGSKRGLFERAAQSYLREIAEPMLIAMEADGSGKQELADYFLTLAATIRASPPHAAKRGCLMINTAMELDDLDAQATQMVHSWRHRVREAIFQSLKPIGSVRDRAATADLLTASHIGLLVTARIDPPEAATFAEALAADIRSW
ncbi:MAG TPA: TetR/AcrR family transcriptional regulator [Pseudonocardia sp.]|nr:TetR/AcrR family transcriptional regulator [Pseudonocardia sp.]HTF52672.1 TetR/AcrR family transcriptional regulator [Pseudonocardia sp.]